MKHSLGYEVGDTVYVFHHNYGSQTVEAGVVKKLTPSGQMVVRSEKKYFNGENIEHRFNKYGNVVGGSYHNRPYIREKDQQEAHYLVIKGRQDAREWQSRLIHMVRNLEASAIMGTEEQRELANQILLHVEQGIADNVKEKLL